MIIVAIFIISLALFFWGLQRDDGIAAFGIIILLILIIVVGISYNSNIGNIARLEAFQEYNIKNYSMVVSETEAILSKEKFEKASMIEGSIEKVNIGAEISNRMVELREAVNKYNNSLASLRAYRKNKVIGGIFIVPPVPENLNFIVVE